MKMEKIFLEKLASRTIDYFKEDLSISIDKDFTIELSDEVCYSDITVLISLSKDMIGTIGMSVSNDFALKIAKSFIFGEIPMEELDELKEESVAETLNVTLGNILKELPLIIDGGEIDISIPYIMTNKTCIKKKANGEMLVYKLVFKDEIIILSYFN